MVSACGLINYGSRSGSGGTPSPLYYPWAVSIADKGGKSFCGGVLINRKEVLSAAHCFEGKSTDNINLILGVHDISRATATDKYRVQKLTIHPQYKKFAEDNTFQNDVALLVIEGDVPSFPNIQPICLPKSPPNYDVGDDVTVLGWGQLSDDKQNMAQRLQMLEQAQTPINVCGQIWKKKFNPSETICMGEGGHNICKGDEGGPLMVTNSQGRQALLGIASYSGPTCGDKYPGVYSNFESIRDWVKKNSLGSCE
jgi:corin